MTKIMKCNWLSDFWLIMIIFREFPEKCSFDPGNQRQTMGHKMDSFRLLLNEISQHLTDQNLQSLIHIYNVPGSKKNKMNNGLALFEYMINQDFISRERIGNVHYLMRKIGRKDLVRLVDDYINKEFPPEEIHSIRNDFSDSWEKDSQNKRGSSVTVPEEPPVCGISCVNSCVYLNCVCRRVPSCYIPAVVILLFSIIATVVFWYAHVPEVSQAIQSNEDVKVAGLSILLLEIFLLFVLLGFCMRKKIASCLCVQNPGYNELVNPSVNCVQEGPSQPITSHASTDERLQSVPRSFKASETDSAHCTFSSVSTFGTFDTNDLPDSSEPEA